MIPNAGIIWANCLDKLSNVEQLDVLNVPVMTAQHVGHMDGARRDASAGKGPTAHQRQEETVCAQVNGE